MFDFHAHPGMLYVWATVLPLASFLLLLLVGALRAALRPYRESPACGGLYRLVGGDAPGRTAAYVATAAIGGAFILSFIGFIMHARDAASEHDSHAAHAKTEEGHGEKGHAGKGTEFEGRWQAKLEWARVGPTRDDPHTGPAPASVLSLGYKIDHLSTIMFLMVTLIATLIHIYSIGYMGDELGANVADHQVHTDHGHLHRRGRFGRFFMFLSLFCFSMLNLVLADNLFQVFLSWELVGVCSYLLISFYYERQSASNAGNKAFIVNRVGDAGFIVGLLILWTYVGTLNFDDVFRHLRAPLKDSNDKAVALSLQGQFVRAKIVAETDQGKVLEIAPRDGGQILLLPQNFEAAEIQPTTGDAPTTIEVSKVGRPVGSDFSKAPDKVHFGSMPYWLLVVAGLGIFLGCVGKSAQFPLQVWLPDAMEGPTPVSALIHAATMVAAGVYLVGRCYPLFTDESRLVIAYTGGITLFVAATIAIVMTDIKKVLAYSTVSQLGYMMLALGVGGWAAGLFHLLTHAFFKALLFLGSGSVIYGCHHEQEMTKMGGLLKKMPITAFTMLAGVLAIAGTPLFSGWYSKDAIIAQAFGFAALNGKHALLFILPLVTAGITTFYMFRMWFMTFTGDPKDAHVYEHAHEAPRAMTIPLIILAFFSVVVAWGWPIWDPESSLMESHIHHAQHHSVLADFGTLASETELPIIKGIDQSERRVAEENHTLAGLAALLVAVLGLVFASLIYLFRKFDPADAKAQFPGVYDFLAHKWYFDELYSVLLVRPALTIAGWCKSFDTRVIDGTVDSTARRTIWSADQTGLFDLGVIDGLVNLTGRVVFGVGNWLRNVQTGFLRSYVLFLVLAAIALYALMYYFVSLASAG